MPKFFVMSDVHGYYTQMKQALDETGFDEHNPDHWLIGCGDYLDRGREPMETIRYLHNLPRKILVRGNHEELLEECCYRGESLLHDWQNGIAQTIKDIVQDRCYGYFPDECEYVLKRTAPFRAQMLPYFETENHIFVHSFIPLIEKNHSLEFNPDWRNATPKEWRKAAWGNPYKFASAGLLPDKTLVFGHFHTSYPRFWYEGKSEFGKDADFSIYYGDGYIAIDGCTAHSGTVNVLVLEDNFIDKNKSERK